MIALHLAMTQKITKNKIYVLNTILTYHLLFLLFIFPRINPVKFVNLRINFGIFKFFQAVLKQKPKQQKTKEKLHTVNIFLSTVI